MDRLTHGTQLFGDSEKQALYRRLKEYEDLEEQGKLLKLPCAVGDVVYNIIDDSTDYVVLELKVTDISINKIFYNGVDCYDDISEIGKTIFLTKSEAEEALKKMNEREGEDGE